MAEVDFSKLKKEELVDMVKELEAKVSGLMALDSGAKSGLINSGGLWARDKNGKPYQDKNGNRIWIGEERRRIMMMINPFKTDENGQPDLRIATLPYRAPASQDNKDIYDSLDGVVQDDNPLL